MKKNYVVWETKGEKNVCCLTEFRGVEKAYQLRKGISRVNDFGKEAAFVMDPDFPNDTALGDCLINVHNLIVVSARVKEFVESKKIEKIEFLPVSIIDLGGKVASSDYWIIHPIDPIDCIVASKCNPRYSKIDKAVIMNIDKLVIDESKIPKGREIFRIKSFHKLVLVDCKLAKSITDAGFSGIRWVDVSDYPEE